MATQTFTLVLNNASDANFRAWGLALHNAIVACGLVHVAQTGDIDFTTVVAPASANQYRGSRIYRFDDALQATNPVFIRIEFGATTGGATQAAVRVTVGNGVDGAGAFLTSSGFGNTTARALMLNNSTPPSAISFVSGANNRLQFLLAPLGQPSSNSVPFFSIERQHDSAGADIVDGVMILAMGGSSTTGFQKLFTKEGIELDCSDGSNTLFGAIRASVTSAIFGLKVGTFPFHFFKATLVPPPLGALLYYTADYPVTTYGTTITVTVYGATHTYLLCGFSLYQVRGSGTSSVVSIAMRYE